MIEAVQVVPLVTQGSYCYGQVELPPGVAIADQVILGAAPGCRLVIGPGVCLGPGVMIQAYRGDLMVESGAILGSGVLVVGHGRIGPKVCIGAGSTVIDPTLRANQVIPPQSLLGDPSQPLLESANILSQPTQTSMDWAATSSPTSPASLPPESTQEIPPSPPPSSYIHGKQQVQQLLDTLFPQRRSLNGLAPEDRL